MQDGELEERLITPGFTSVRDLINQVSPYGMKEQDILYLIQTGFMQAHAPSSNGMHWLPLTEKVDYHDCYVKECDAKQCFGSLQKMVFYEEKYCQWNRNSGPFDTHTELCRIYLPWVVKHNPYIPQNIIDGCIDLCECNLNGSDVLEVVFHSEQERQNGLLCNDLGPCLLPGHADVVVGAYVAFELILRLRNIGIAKSNQYYPVRYVKMPLPE